MPVEIDNLTAKQRRRYESVKRMRESEDMRVRRAMNITREAVRVALEVGVPARLLATALSLSHARIYQMRDEAIAFDAEAEETERAELDALYQQRPRSAKG